MRPSKKTCNHASDTQRPQEHVRNSGHRVSLVQMGVSFGGQLVLWLKGISKGVRGSPISTVGVGFPGQQRHPGNLLVDQFFT